VCLVTLVIGDGRSFSHGNKRKGRQRSGNLRQAGERLAGGEASSNPNVGPAGVWGKQGTWLDVVEGTTANWGEKIMKAEV